MNRLIIYLEGERIRTLLLCLKRCNIVIPTDVLKHLVLTYFDESHVSGVWDLKRCTMRVNQKTFTPLPAVLFAYCSVSWITYRVSTTDKQYALAYAHRMHRYLKILPRDYCVYSVFSDLRAPGEFQTKYGYLYLQTILIDHKKRQICFTWVPRSEFI